MEGPIDLLSPFRVVFFAFPGAFSLIPTFSSVSTTFS
jgi:hypothetical protein